MIPNDRLLCVCARKRYESTLSQFFMTQRVIEGLAMLLAFVKVCGIVANKDVCLRAETTHALIQSSLCLSFHSLDRALQER